MPKTNEYLWPYVLWGLANFGKPAKEALDALPAALPDFLRNDTPPLRLPIGTKNTTRNMSHLSMAARLALAFFANAGLPAWMLGKPGNWRSVVNDSVELYAEEFASGRWGKEFYCPAPHDAFYYGCMLLTRQVAVAADSPRLLASTDRYDAGHLWLLIQLIAFGQLYPPGHRYGGAPEQLPVPDHSLGEAWLKLAHGGSVTGHMTSNGKPIVESFKAFYDSGGRLAAAGAQPGAPRLLWPIRKREWPDLVTFEMSSKAASEVNSPDPVAWTAVHADGRKELSRIWDPGPPRGVGFPKETILGGSW
jgi:hypothetical protein